MCTEEGEDVENGENGEDVEDVEDGEDVENGEDTLVKRTRKRIKAVSSTVG